jgi:hypothetical protein
MVEEYNDRLLRVDGHFEGEDFRFKAEVEEHVIRKAKVVEA